MDTRNKLFGRRHLSWSKNSSIKMFRVLQPCVKKLNSLDNGCIDLFFFITFTYHIQQKIMCLYFFFVRVFSILLETKCNTSIKRPNGTYYETLEPLLTNYCKIRLELLLSNKLFISRTFLRSQNRKHLTLI